MPLGHNGRAGGLVSRQSVIGGCLGRPIVHGSLTIQPYTADSDPLGFEEMAEALARLILGLGGSSTPFTLGIEAGWDWEGSPMHRLERTLATDPSVTTVWFNGGTARKAPLSRG